MNIKYRVIFFVDYSCSINEKIIFYKRYLSASFSHDLKYFNNFKYFTSISLKIGM